MSLIENFTIEIYSLSICRESIDNFITDKTCSASIVVNIESADVYLMIELCFYECSSNRRYVTIESHGVTKNVK